MQNYIYGNTWCENDNQLIELHAREPDRAELTVVGRGLTNLSALERFTQLQSLYIGGVYHTGAHPAYCDTIQDFSALCHLSHLQYLQIHDCRHFNEQQLEFVARIPELQGLSITSFMHTIQDFSALVNATKIQILELAGILDLKPLSNLANLRFLHITNLSSAHLIDDFTPLGYLVELQELTLEFSGHGKIDLRPLSAISTLKVLDLSPCQIGLDVPYLDLLAAQLTMCHIIPVSKPSYGKTAKIFQTWVISLEKQL